MTQLKLRKVYYRTNFNFATGEIAYPAKLFTGYIVTGLYGKGKFYIPESYNGLKIIGITWEAFKQLPEYETGNKMAIYTTLVPEIYFHKDSLLFIQIPPRYNNACRVYPAYFLDKQNGRYIHMVGGMCYNQNYNQIKDLLDYIEKPYNYGYSVTGKVVITKTVYNKRYTAEPTFNMGSSNNELEDHKVGWYFEDPLFTLSEISDLMSSKQVILAYIRTVYVSAANPFEYVQLVYNVINGCDVFIDCSNPDKPGVSYYLA